MLIADNDIESSSSLQLMLHTSGYSQTRVAYSGYAALAIAAEFQPCVLLELNLLDMSGYEVARLMRRPRITPQSAASSGPAMQIKRCEERNLPQYVPAAKHRKHCPGTCISRGPWAGTPTALRSSEAVFLEHPPLQS